MEISSDTLWRLTLEQGAAWLRAWRLARDMTQAEAASALGVSPRMWRYYEAGEHPLPKTVGLAAVGLDAQLRQSEADRATAKPLRRRRRAAYVLG